MTTLVLVDTETVMLPLTDEARVNSWREVEGERVKDVRVEVVGTRSVNRDEEKTVEVASGVCRDRETMRKGGARVSGRMARGARRKGKDESVRGMEKGRENHSHRRPCLRIRRRLSRT